MEYRESWDMSSVPMEVLQSEIAKRYVARRKHHRGGAQRTCTCGKCRKCRNRKYQQARRERLNLETVI